MSDGADLQPLNQSGASVGGGTSGCRQKLDRHTTDIQPIRGMKPVMYLHDVEQPGIT